MMPIQLNDLPQNITEHGIGEYLTENEKSAFTATSRRGQGLFQPHRLQMMVNHLLLQVMQGEQDKVEKILGSRPELLEMTGHATDYSGRTFTTTAFRYALWAWDTRYMCNMMLDCLSNSPQDEAIKQGLLTQFKAHLQDGVFYELNGALIHEVHFNFSPIKASLQACIDENENWDAPDDWVAMEHQWCKVVGHAQRLIPAHVAQHYCDSDNLFYPTPSFKKKTFKRSLVLLNRLTNTTQHWFASVSSTSGLGIDFGICGSGYLGRKLSARRRGVGESVDLAALTALSEARKADLFTLLQRLESLTQQSDVDSEIRPIMMS